MSDPIEIVHGRIIERIVNWEFAADKAKELGEASAAAKFLAVKCELEAVLRVTGELRPEPKTQPSTFPDGTPLPTNEPITGVIQDDNTSSNHHDSSAPDFPEPSTIEGKPKNYTQMAGIYCNKQAFWKFVEDEYKETCGNNLDAAEFVRSHCDVGSRSELAEYKPGQQKWDALQSEFDTWMRM